MIGLVESCLIHPGKLENRPRLAVESPAYIDVPVLVDGDQAALLQHLDQRLVLLQHLAGLVELRLQRGHFLLQLLHVGGSGWIGSGVAAGAGRRAATGRILDGHGVVVSERVNADDEDAKADHGGNEYGGKQGGEMFLHCLFPFWCCSIVHLLAPTISGQHDSQMNSQLMGRLREGGTARFDLTSYGRVV